MIQVALEYRPIEFIPWMRRIETHFPARWSEMNAEQIAAIPDLQRGRIDDSKLLHIFLGVKLSVARRVGSFQKFCILRHLKYIQNPEPIGYFVIKKLGWFKAPANNLKGVTFGTFVFGDTYYQNYSAGKKSDLNRFIACYYTGKKGFDEKLIEQNAKIISTFPLAKREAIAINYGLVREWLGQAYPYVFQKTEPGQKTDKSAGWVNVFDAVVGDDIGNQDKYAQLPVSTVLRYLNNRTKNFYKYGSKV